MFDPFGDFKTEGYLRNNFRIKNMHMISRLERVEFEKNIYHVLKYLESRRRLTKENICNAHGLLFRRLYSWAGKTRDELVPFMEISKGNYDHLFAKPGTVNAAIHYALSWGSDRDKMREEPGTVMGMLAYAHPFLDGNGRTIMAIHLNLCRRAGFYIAWRKTSRDEYLERLTMELQHPHKNILDEYLKEYVVEGSRSLAEDVYALIQLKGLSKSDKEIQRDQLQKEKGF